MNAFFHRIIKSPYDHYCGENFTVKGDFWPDSTPSENAKEYTVFASEVNENFKETPLSKPSVRVKVVLVPQDDPFLTASTRMEEGVHFWWVRIDTFSQYWFKDKERKEKELAASQAIQAQSAEAEAISATSVDIEIKAERTFTLAPFFDKEAGALEGRPGTFWKCKVPGCTSRFFVGKGSKFS